MRALVRADRRALSFRTSSKVMYGAQRSALVADAVLQSQSSAAETGALVLKLALVYWVIMLVCL
jgi:hypothetical protein